MNRIMSVSSINHCATETVDCCFVAGWHCFPILLHLPVAKVLVAHLALSQLTLILHVSNDGLHTHEQLAQILSFAYGIVVCLVLNVPHMAVAIIHYMFTTSNEQHRHHVK